MDSNPQNKIMLALGEISGELKGIQRQIQASNDSTNRRIEDLKKSIDDNFKAINDRISSVSQRVTVLEEKHTSLLVKTTTWGSIGGAMAAAIVQLLRVKF